MFYKISLSLLFKLTSGLFLKAREYTYKKQQRVGVRDVSRPWSAGTWSRSQTSRVQTTERAAAGHPRTTPNNPYRLLYSPSLVGLECEASPPLSLYLLFHFAECFANLCWPLFLSAKGFVVRSVTCVCMHVQYICVTYSYCFICALSIFSLILFNYQCRIYRTLVFVENTYLFKINTFFQIQTGFN